MTLNEVDKWRLKDFYKLKLFFLRLEFLILVLNLHFIKDLILKYDN